MTQDGGNGGVGSSEDDVGARMDPLTMGRIEGSDRGGSADGPVVPSDPLTRGRIEDSDRGGSADGPVVPSDGTEEKHDASPTNGHHEESVSGVPSPPAESSCQEPPERRMYSREETASSLSVTAIPEPTKKTGLKVLFLSSDTGGGHRASAESLARQFELLYPGSTYDLLDVMRDHAPAPYSYLVSSYKHLSARPAQWRLVYKVSNTRAYEALADVHLKLMCERAVRRRIKSYDPDVVVSVHPLMTNVPVLACNNISKETGRHLPIFTVVTDLGSAHCLWFDSGVEKVFVASDQVAALAKDRGKVPDEKLVRTGLPIRHDFAVHAEMLDGDRTSPDGRAYQRTVRDQLRLNRRDQIVLVMGGGEGVGSLSSIVNALYVDLVRKGIHATVLVVCGRNGALKTEIDERDWDGVLKRAEAKEARMRRMSRKTMGREMKRILSSNLDIEKMKARRHYMNQTMSCSTSAPCLDSSANSSFQEEEVKVEEKDDGEIYSGVELLDATAFPSVIDSTPSSPNDSGDDDDDDDEEAQPMYIPNHGNVTVIGLGFVTRMAEYMVAADLLLSKAGPGTIAEAASLGLPVMLTSFLPGQEEGNVDFVVENEFGEYKSDHDPDAIAREVGRWLMDKELLQTMSRKAMTAGVPRAAADIVKVIGDSALKWKAINEDRDSSSDVIEGSEGVEVAVDDLATREDETA